ncbi:MAG: phosphoribosylformylglycinamidine synthase subunit PurQ [Deltaproteobacteria bacterium]|nr:phosphoribosylformylglycinamidine synthase subunit PurQ [Deltaproteobacteria bacterium]
MSRFKGLVLTGYGLNCDYETCHALELSGFEPQRVHINQLIAGQVKLDHFHLLVFGGGFSWADDHGAGVLLAHRIRSNLEPELKEFVASGRLVLGICNGFQALVNLGLLPAFDGQWQRQVAIIANDCGNFRDQWIGLVFNPGCPSVFTRGLDQLDLPVRHGEGKFFAQPQVIDRLEGDNLVAARYRGQEGGPAQGRFPFNPNGSLNDIAALTDPSGRVLGLMPHPEAFSHLTNHPDWPLVVDAAKRKSQKIDWRGQGLKLFDNALAYLQAQA